MIPLLLTILVVVVGVLLSDKEDLRKYDDTDFLGNK
mgnify:CR=1 FL=1